MPGVAATGPYRPVLGADFCGTRNPVSQKYWEGGGGEERGREGREREGREGRREGGERGKDGGGRDKQREVSEGREDRGES